MSDAFLELRLLLDEVLEDLEESISNTRDDLPPALKISALAHTANSLENVGMRDSAVRLKADIAQFSKLIQEVLSPQKNPSGISPERKIQGLHYMAAGMRKYLKRLRSARGG
ncbi:MAG: hypothetical protein ABI614_09475 [Planctomycetota bacterium]